MLAPRELISAHPWKRATFTTYALSLSFFEAIVLDGLVRGGGSGATIIADVNGVRGSLGEQGAQLVGKEYDVEPIAVDGGVFHAKLTALSSPDECHLLVGSGNLTFGGWGGNCEVLEHLHPSFAPDAIADAAGFFDLLPATPRIRLGSADACSATAEALRGAIPAKALTGRIKLLHNLRLSLAEQIAQLVGDLGGAVRLTGAAPYWDNGAGIDSVCELIGLDHAYVHSHAFGYVEGRADNWPRKARTSVEPVRVAMFHSEESRRLHAKAFEVLCKRGRLIISGSANGTTAALGNHGNAEACVARVQREVMVGWTFTGAEPPEAVRVTEDAGDDEASPTGVFRAELENGVVIGRILTKAKPVGTVRVYHAARADSTEIATTEVDPDGAFTFNAPELEELSWRQGRVVLRLKGGDGYQAEGFVAVTTVADITRRVGRVARHMFAVLSGSDAPADVLAIISWFSENPDRLTADHAGPTHVSDSPVRDHELAPVSVALLGARDGGLASTGGQAGVSSGMTWVRIVDQLVRGLRRGSKSGGAKGPAVRRRNTADDDDDDDDDAERQAEGARSFTPLGFTNLVEFLTRPEASSRDVFVALDMVGYVVVHCDSSPVEAKRWYDKIVPAMERAGVPPDRLKDAAVVTISSMSGGAAGDQLRRARASLINLGVDVGGDPPSQDDASAFIAEPPSDAELSRLWSELRSVRTYLEQTTAYWCALEANAAAASYPDLAAAAPEECKVLRKAFVSARARSMLLAAPVGSVVCPACDMKLPPSEILKIRTIGIATAVNCCQRILVTREA